MATIQRNILIRDRMNVKQNAKPQPRSRRASDAVSATSDAAIRQIQNARFSVAQDNAEALGAVNPARVAAGLPDDVPEDVYEYMKNLSK